MAILLTFQRRPTSERAERLTVTFARGATISCATAEQASDLTQRHQQRGEQHGVLDPVVEAVWYCPEFQACR